MSCCDSPTLCCCKKQAKYRYRNALEDSSTNLNFVIGDDTSVNTTTSENRLNRSSKKMVGDIRISTPVLRHESEQLDSTLIKESETIIRLSTINLPSTKYSAVRALIYSLSAILSRTPQAIMELMDKSFFDIGGNSENTMIAIICLQHYKYKIDVLDFLAAETLRDIALVMHRVGEPYISSNPPLEKVYTVRKMKARDLEFLLRCFQESEIKGDGPEWAEIWKTAIKQSYFFIFLRRSDKLPVGVALNFDISDDNHNKLVAYITGKRFTHSDIQKNSFKMSSKTVFLDLLQFLGENLHKKNRMVQPIFFIRKGSTEQDLVAITVFMEEQNFRKVQWLKFKWIVTSYPKPLQARLNDVSLKPFPSKLKDKLWGLKFSYKTRDHRGNQY